MGQARPIHSGQESVIPVGAGGFRRHGLPFGAKAHGKLTLRKALSFNASPAHAYAEE